MKKILIVLGILVCGLLNTQILSVPTSYITSTSAVRDSFINWTIRSQIISLDTEDGTSTFTITTSWNPSNANLNALENAGGNTSNWPIYLVVNDSTFFTEEISSFLTTNDINVLGRYTEPKKTWGEYFKKYHEMWYYSAPNPDQYNILAAKENGTFMTIDEVRQIVSGYTQCTGYRTVYNVNNLKSVMVERSVW